jgi:hypothetical protein
MVSECPLVKNRGGTVLREDWKPHPLAKDIAHWARPLADKIRASCWAGRSVDDRRERGEGRRRWDPREWGTRETRPTPRLRTNFEVSIQLGVPLGYGGKAKEADVR